MRLAATVQVTDSGCVRMESDPAAYDVELRLPEGRSHLTLAREFTHRTLTDGRYRGRHDHVLLVVSELVTNACLHAEGPEELRVSSNAKVLRLEVVDLGTGTPAPRTPHRAGRPGGHGMFIVQRLCLDWGVVRRSDGVGKTVWAELAGPS